MGKNKSNFDFDSGSLVYYIYKKLGILIKISLIAFVISAVVSFLIKPKYQSTVIMFPSAGVSISKSLVSESYTSMKGSFNTFGEEEEAEQLLQVLNSEEMRIRIINRFDLMKHYRIDSTSSYPRTKLYKKFDKNFSFRRTEYLSVVITVLDWDPVLAARMATFTSDMIDTIMNKMQKERARQGYALVKNEYDKLSAHIALLEDSMAVLSKYGVTEYEGPIKGLSRAYSKALLNGNMKLANTIEQKINQAAKYNPFYLSMIRQINWDAEQLAKMKTRFAEVNIELQQSLPHKFVVDQARVAEKKMYPKRSLIVLASTLSAFIITLLSLIIIDNINKYRK